MDAAWVENENCENLKRYLADVHNLAEYITECRAAGIDFDYRNEHALEILIQDEIAQHDPARVDYKQLAKATWGFLMLNDEVQEAIEKRFGELCYWTLSDMEPFDPHAADMLLDQTFELSAGDYIVTDPCYLELDEEFDADGNFAPSPRYWEDNFKAELPSVRMRDTIYGDWGCTMFRVPENMTLENVPQEGLRECACGLFCADTGMVCIVDYNELKRYNPDFIERFENKTANNPFGCNYACVIRNFEGECRFEVTEDKYIDEYSGEPRRIHNLIIVFDGVDTESGKSVRYESRQTDL